MQKTKEGEYVYMVWEGEPPALYVRGHVDQKDAVKAITKEEEHHTRWGKNRRFGEVLHRFGHWGFAGINAPDGCEREFRVYDQPKSGRFKVTEIPIIGYESPR